MRLAAALLYAATLGIAFPSSTALAIHLRTRTLEIEVDTPRSCGCCAAATRRSRGDAYKVSTKRDGATQTPVTAQPQAVDRVEQQLLQMALAARGLDEGDVIGNGKVPSLGWAVELAGKDPAGAGTTTDSHLYHFRRVRTPILDVQVGDTVRLSAAPEHRRLVTAADSSELTWQVETPNAAGPGLTGTVESLDDEGGATMQVRETGGAPGRTLNVKGIDAAVSGGKKSTAPCYLVVGEDEGCWKQQDRLPEPVKQAFRETFRADVAGTDPDHIGDILPDDEVFLNAADGVKGGRQGKEGVLQLETMEV